MEQKKPDLKIPADASQRKAVFPDALVSMCDYLNAITDVDQLTFTFVNSLSDIFQAQKVSLMLADENKNELFVKAFQGLDSHAYQTRVKWGESFSGQVAKEGKAMLVNDVEKECPGISKNRISRYASKSFVIVPVKIGSRILGVVSLTDRVNNAVFSQQDAYLLDLFCHYLALRIENNRLMEHANSITIHDPLTDLYNHRYFHEQLMEEIYRAERYRHPLSLIVIDLDKFSEYNQAHSYSAGDIVLKQTGGLIKENVRQTDLVSRYDLDSFAVILPETKVKEAIFVSEKIREKINFAVFTETEDRQKSLGMERLTVSIGVADHRMGLSKEDLIRHALSALTEAKQRGGNCVCVFKD